MFIFTPCFFFIIAVAADAALMPLPHADADATPRYAAAAHYVSADTRHAAARC